MKLSPLRALVLASLAVILAVPAASAHATIYTPDNKIKFVYGNLGEPVYTYVKTGLDLSVFDNSTGAPIGGLESVSHGVAKTPKINVTIRYGEAGGPEKNITTDFRDQFGKRGWYTHPITYTRPGLYYVVIKGNINGTFVNLALAPAHPIEAESTIMWPDQATLPGEQDDKIEALQTEVAALKSEINTLKTQSDDEEDGGKGLPGFEAVLLVLVLLGALVLRRRT